jgi:hypothetical protein
VLKIDTKHKKKAERSFSLHPQAILEWLPLYAEKTFFRKAFSDTGKVAALFCGSAGTCEIP